MKVLNFIVLGLIAGYFIACTSSKDRIAPANTQQLALRVVQAKTYSEDKETLFRVALATLQDLGFSIESTNKQVGMITANNGGLRFSVVVQTRQNGLSGVRVNARYGQTGISDASVYQNFFSAFDKSLHLDREGL